MKLGPFSISFNSKKAEPVKAETHQKQLTAANAANAALTTIVRAKYDAAQTTRENARHWAMADSLSADEANSPGVRETLRNRARYEYSNSCYLKGIIRTKSNYMVGRGPRLQIKVPRHLENLRTEKGNKIPQEITRNQLTRLARQIEIEFRKWAKEIKLAKKLRTMYETRVRDGEVFVILKSRKKFKKVSLDLHLVEAQHISSGFSFKLDPKNIDGVNLDDDGYPEAYTIRLDNLTQKFERIPAKYVIHYFDAERPGQHRGIPGVTQGLNLFAYLRDYTISVIQAARNAADFSLFLETNGPDYDETPAVGTVPEGEEIEAFDTIPVERATLNVMPHGTKAGMLKAEQPVNTYPDFKHEIVNEFGRGVNTPYNMAAGNSSGYNYASGRLDVQDFIKDNEIERQDMEDDVIDRIISAFVAELSYFPEFRLLRELGDFLPHYLIWDGFPHADPLKNASAQTIKLKNWTTTEADELAAEGKDVEEVQEQRVDEIKRKKELLQEAGITIEEAAALSTISANENHAEILNMILDKLEENTDG